MRKVTIIAVVISIFTAHATFALDTATHQYFNEDIAVKSLNGFSLDSYLKNTLGMQEGVSERLTSNLSGFNSIKIQDWISKGGLYEDKPPLVPPYIRSANHFHNPLTDEGFTGIPSGDSAIVWSQKLKNQQWIGGHYSWPDSRENFYSALIATDKTSRDEKFAETFRGVGQLMHLMQDMSVPEHARNDLFIFVQGGKS